MTVIESIVKDLSALPPAKVAEVARFVHSLSEVERAERLKILLETQGAFSPEDADAVEKAINEGCERIDARDW